MADGDFRLELGEDLGRRLKAAAALAGRSVDDFAAGLITQGLQGGWAEDVARYEDYRRTGEYLDAATAMRAMQDDLKGRLRARRK